MFPINIQVQSGTIPFVPLRDTKIGFNAVMSFWVIATYPTLWAVFRSKDTTTSHSGGITTTSPRTNSRDRFSRVLCTLFYRTRSAYEQNQFLCRRSVLEKVSSMILLVVWGGMVPSASYTVWHLIRPRRSQIWFRDTNTDSDRLKMPIFVCGRPGVSNIMTGHARHVIPLVQVSST